jgi:hypothetical protein
MSHTGAGLTCRSVRSSLLGSLSNQVRLLDFASFSRQRNNSTGVKAAANPITALFALGLHERLFGGGHFVVPPAL